VSGGLRQATPADAAQIERVCSAAFGFENDPERLRRFGAREQRILAEEPDCCRVIESADGLLDAVALAVVREGIWVLATLAVHPGGQSGGAGRQVIEAAHAAGEGCHGWLIGATEDPRAWRLYHSLGLAIRPAIGASGKLDRALIPALPQVRDGDAGDLEECAAIDREIRGGARTRDLEALLADGDPLYRTDGGFALGFRGTVLTLAARTEEEATALLWRVWADTPDGREAGSLWIDARQAWAVSAALSARLSLKPDGPYFTGGRLGPLTPWIPHSALL
jgi:GNAT superfamily N-acetyltransferase